jgi:hypothetical protein
VPKKKGENSVSGDAGKENKENGAPVGGEVKKTEGENEEKEVAAAV